MSLSKRFGLIAIAVLLATPGEVRADTCLSDSSNSESAEGMVSIGVTPTGAKPFILKLSSPVCLTAADAEDSVKSSMEVHIFSSVPAVHAEIQKFVGRLVVVHGRVFPAHTRYHHAPIVMDLSQID